MKRVVLLVVAVFISVMTFAQDQSPSELMNEANTAVQNKNFEKAIELFESVLAIPDHGQNEENINGVLNQLRPAVAKSKASDALDNKEYDKAIELYKAAIADYPEAGIEEQAGKMFYNEGIKSYKGEEFVDAANFFAISQNDFGYAKAEKYKDASLKKAAEALVAEGKSSVDGVNISAENKTGLLENLAKVYFSQGYEKYQEGAATIKQATEEVNSGSYTTLDDQYKNAVAKGKKSFEQAIPLLKKALELDPNHANAKKVLDACEQSL
ncbi:tetratricopeptide repeat protein [Draconibacterium halophilum]|uniref:Tetratricopeptide repeat protein n=1 Tax=Draconibacterium halophilum TaxID=2706887 RepID=A0A6C0RIQ8_9BACT|nr:tetratricopeptide repeat protein [Draconibacterium halophilum]QIA09966.1 tetratricopeptide repeat protein [Draconibacterium halophilum]